MREEVTLNKKEQRRLMILNKLEQGELKNREVAQLLCLSERHVKRLRSGYSVRGAEALAHGNRGRISVHAVCDEIRNRIVDLVQQKYMGFNQQHFTEMLIEREGISVSRSTVRRILSKAGIRSPRRGGEGRQNTVNAGTAIPRKGCCFRSMAVPMVGLKKGARGLV
jgi:transposase